MGEGNMYKTLIIEDDPVIATLLEEGLGKWGFEAHVTDFMKVMEEFNQFQPHLVLLDISLPFYNGYYWCNEIRKNGIIYHYNSKRFLLTYQNGEVMLPKSQLVYSSYAEMDILDLSVITLSEFNRICGTDKELEDGQIIMLSNSKYKDVDQFRVSVGNDIKIYNIISHLSDTLFTTGKNRKANEEVFFVVKDQKDISQIKQQNASENLRYILNIKGSNEDGYQYCKDMFGKLKEVTDSYSYDSIYTSRASCYSLYGGLLFMGAFFTVLFLCATVLIIYFKQISEGYEDKERFEMLQKVGMDDQEVKRTINKQILIVFFLPLLGALLHLSMASHIIIKLLGVFMLYNNKLTILCMVGSCLVFTLVYVFVYRLTARTYCRIVRW